MENLKNLDKPPRSCEKTEVLGPFQTYSNVPTEGRYLYKLNHTNGDLINMFIKATIRFTDGAGNIPAGKYFAAQFLRRIGLKTESSTISSLNPLYIHGRIDDSKDSQAYARYFNSVDGAAIEINKDVIYYIPVFFFFSRKNPFSIKNRPQLYVEIEEAGSNLKMGTTSNVSFTKYELVVRYIQYLDYRNEIPKSLIVPNIFPEKSVLCKIGSTSNTVLLKCPYRVFHIYCYVKSLVGFSLKNIKRVVLSCPTSVIFDSTDENNYICGDPTDLDGYNQNSTFSIKFGERTSDEFISFNEDMYPCYLTVEYEAPTVTDHNLEVICEYRNEIDSNTNVVMTGTFT